MRWCLLELFLILIRKCWFQEFKEALGYCLESQPGQLKFNIDGSSAGNPGQSDATLAELLAVKEAFLLFAASKWANSHELLLEYDNYNVVKWIISPAFVPWKMRKHLSVIEIAKLEICGFRIQHISRSVNMEADLLAKSEVGRTNAHNVVVTPRPNIS
ncbi:hypothetical protein REPUB_Repub13aG0180900 [Reevesia pubescens]